MPAVTRHEAEFIIHTKHRVLQPAHLVFQTLLASPDLPELSRDLRLHSEHIQHGHCAAPQPPLLRPHLPHPVDGSLQTGLLFQHPAVQSPDEASLYLLGCSFLVEFEEPPGALDDVSGLVLEAFAYVGLQHEVVHVALGAGQLQLPCQHGHHQGCAPRPHHPAHHRHPPPAHRVGHDVAVADGQEGAGYHPHAVEEIAVHPGVGGVVVHLAQPQRPGGEEEEGQHEETEGVLWVQRHDGLEDEAKVEADTVDNSDAWRAGVLEQT
eukprot:GHVL01000660.1.p2 GENE.GHVL01000660.1~~GHVL01000660.1.p2  ORF type:complete len:265 (+),score=30.14 GHVL01000660.1:315-1109(+)